MTFVRDDYAKWVPKAAKTLIDYMSIDGISGRFSVDECDGLIDLARKRRLSISDGCGKSVLSPMFSVECGIRNKARHASGAGWETEGSLKDMRLRIEAKTLITGKAKLQYRTGRGKAAVIHVLEAPDMKQLIKMAKSACPEELWASMSSLFLLKTGFAPPDLSDD